MHCSYKTIRDTVKKIVHFIAYNRKSFLKIIFLEKVLTV